jgi:glutathione S-transferase
MKLYYAPGACSLAARISLHEAGIEADFERVDLRSKTTEHGYDYTAINPKGYVPLLVLDEGARVTEIVAVLMLIADREPELAARGPLGRTRTIEMLSFLSSELHPAFKPLFHDPGYAERAAGDQLIRKRLDLLTEQIHELYLFGPHFTVADAFLFVILRWAQAFDVGVSAQMLGYFERVAERPAVRWALAEEGLALPAAPSRPELRVSVQP